MSHSLPSPSSKAEYTPLLIANTLPIALWTSQIPLPCFITEQTIKAIL
jgi:hypothetical protein